MIKTYKYNKIFFLFISLIHICFIFSAAGAQEKSSWEPPLPLLDAFDWVQLTSGEWLKGEIKGLYDNELEFDSDKLKLQTFEWKDIRILRSPRLFSVRISGTLTLFGSIEIDEQKVIVTWGEEREEFDRWQLIAIAPFGEKERDFWSGKMSLGVNLTKGNTDQVQYNANFTIKRNTAKTRFSADYLSNISETNGDRTVDSNRVQGQFDIYKTKKYYYRPVFGEYFSDPLKNIKYKATIGCGIGYYLINTPKTEWEIGAGPGYQQTRFESVELEQANSESSMVFMGMTVFDTELTSKIDFVFKYSYQILNQVSGRYTHHTITSFEIELTDKIDFDISFVWDRVQEPKPDDSGYIPDKDDFNIQLGIGIEF